MDSGSQDLWVGDDAQGGSLVSSGSGLSRTDFDNFTPDIVAAKKASSVPNGRVPREKPPGVLRIGDAALLRNGQPTLPVEKAFAIQIGWRLFRLSGASIMSDGECEPVERMVDCTMLKSLERPPTSLPISKNNSAWMRVGKVDKRHFSSTEIQTLLLISAGIYKVGLFMLQLVVSILIGCHRLLGPSSR